MKRMLQWFCLLALIIPGAGRAADRNAELLGFYVQPATLDYNKLQGFAWPDVKEMDAVVRVRLAGIKREEKVTVFLVLFDEDDEVFKKEKQKVWLPEGEHDIVFPDLISTGSVLGDRDFRAEIEVSMPGSLVLRDELDFSITGPDPPDVSILEMELYNPEENRGYSQFSPGDEFVLNALIEIQDNETEIEPSIVLYAAMEADVFELNPELDYQPYDEPWESRQFQVDEGTYRLTAGGHLPYFFTDPYRGDHEFRIWLIVDFGPGAETEDYLLEELQDYSAGEHRASDDMHDKLIEIAPGYTWELRRVSDEERDHHRWWE